LKAKVTQCIDCNRDIFYKTRKPKRCAECMAEYRKQYKRKWYLRRGAPKKEIERKFLRDVLDNRELRVKLRLDWDHFIGRGSHYFTNLRKIWIKREGLWRIKSAHDLEEWTQGRKKHYTKYFD
jgi:hypothetical protein